MPATAALHSAAESCRPAALASEPPYVHSSVGCLTCCCCLCCHCWHRPCTACSAELTTVLKWEQPGLVKSQPKPAVSPFTRFSCCWPQSVPCRYRFRLCKKVSGIQHFKPFSQRSKPLQQIRVLCCEAFISRQTGVAAGDQCFVAVILVRVCRSACPDHGVATRTSVGHGSPMHAYIRGGGQDCFSARCF